MTKTAICDDATIRAYLTPLIRAQSCPCEIVEYASTGGCPADAQEMDLLFLDIGLAPDRPNSTELARLGLFLLFIILLLQWNSQGLSRFFEKDRLL